MFLQVCPVEGRWVQQILPKLHNINVGRLSGGATAARAKQEESQAAAAAAGTTSTGGEQGAVQQVGIGERRNADDAVEAARARYLARKAQKGK